MIELLFLLLPIAALYGYFMGISSEQKKQNENENKISRNYVDGLNYLLVDDKDKALNIFVNLLKDDSEKLEANLTLGALYRAKGEINKAIHIHEALLESTSFNFEQKLLIMQQLGSDYMVAGIYDRAEAYFVQLSDEAELQIYALKQLVIIYQATNEWYKAINASKQLIKLGENQYKKFIAHHFCELALNASANFDFSKTHNLLLKSYTSNPKSARTLIMIGKNYISNKQYKKALKFLTEVVNSEQAFIGEALPFIKICYNNLNDKIGFIKLLRKVIRLCKNDNMATLMLAEFLEEKSGKDVAQTYIKRQLTYKPSLIGFNKLIEYQIEQAEAGKAKESLLLIKNMVEQRLKQMPKYCCEICGFTVNTFYWHCPSCRNWSSILPNHSVNLKQ